MLELLMELCKQKKYVSIYTDNTSKFIFGQILCVNEYYIIIYMISPDGYFDGLLLKNTYEITRIEIDGQYGNKMKKLLSLYELPECEYSFDEEKILESFLSMAIQTRQIVSIELMNSGCSDIVGFIEKIENGLCTTKLVDEYGAYDGKSFFRMQDITQISYASQDENRVLKLWYMA